MPIPGLSAGDSRFLESLQRVGLTTLYGNRIVAALIKHKWDTYGFAAHMVQFAAALVALAATLTAVFLAQALPGHAAPSLATPNEAALAVSVATVAAWALYELAVTLLEVRSLGPLRFCSDLFSVLMVFRVAAALAATVTFYAQADGFREALVTTAYLHHLGIFYYLQPLPKVRPPPR